MTDALVPLVDFFELLGYQIYLLKHKKGIRLFDGEYNSV